MLVIVSEPYKMAVYSHTLAGQGTSWYAHGITN